MANLYTWDKIIKQFKKEQSEDLTEFLFSNSKIITLNHNSAVLQVDEISYSVLKGENDYFYRVIQNIIQNYMSPNLSLQIVRDESEIVENIIHDSPIITDSEKDIQTKEIVNENTYENTGLKVNFTFDNYFYSYDNQRIIQLSKQVIHDIVNQVNPITFNPLFIYGSSGIGKTHIINALGNELYKANDQLKIKYINSTEFANEYAGIFQGGLGNNGLENFKNRFYQLDVLIVDDIQQLGSREKARQEFFSIFEHMRTNNKLIIITCDIHPKELKYEDRLLTRFKSGLVEQIELPDSDTKTQIFNYNAAKINLKIEEEAIQVFIDNSQNVRDLLGYINSIKLDLLADIEMDSIYTKTQAINKVNNSTGNIRQLTKEDVSGIICEYYEITNSELRSKSRKAVLVKARRFANYFFYNKLKMTHHEIGNFFNQKDHTNSVKTIQSFNEFKAKNETDYDLLSQKINNKR